MRGHVGPKYASSNSTDHSLLKKGCATASLLASMLSGTTNAPFVEFHAAQLQMVFEQAQAFAHHFAGMHRWGTDALQSHRGAIRSLVQAHRAVNARVRLGVTR